MTPSGLLLTATSFLIFGLWIFSIRAAARREYPGRPDLIRAWVVKGLILFIVISSLHWISAASGHLSDFSARPPLFPFFFISLFAVSFYIAFSKFGSLLIRHLSFAALVGFQGFRVLAELVIHFAYREGHAPVQMSFHGYNPDIVPAIAAIILFFMLRKKESRTLIRLWNWLGTASLAVIAFIAVTSMPTPLRLFMSEPSNIWVTTTPFVLLPSVLVTAALTGHLLVFRKLRQ